MPAINGFFFSSEDQLKFLIQKKKEQFIRNKFSLLQIFSPFVFQFIEKFGVKSISTKEKRNERFKFIGKVCLKSCTSFYI